MKIVFTIRPSAVKPPARRSDEGLLASRWTITLAGAIRFFREAVLVAPSEGAKVAAAEGATAPQVDGGGGVRSDGSMWR